MLSAHLRAAETTFRAAVLALVALLAACSLRPSGNDQPRTPSHAPAKPRSIAPVAQPLEQRQPSSLRIPIRSDDPIWGSPIAPVTIVEFTDFECPFCARAQATLVELQKRYGPEQLRIVIKQFPFHEHSEQAARFALAVHRQGGNDAFFRFVALAFDQQDHVASEAALRRFAEESGVPGDVAAAVAAGPEVTAKLLIDADVVQKLGITGTPTFFINGAGVVGAQPLSDFAALIDVELAAARKLALEGMAPQLVYPTRVGVNAVEAAARAPVGSNQADPEHEGESENEAVIWKVPVSGTPMRGARDALVTIVQFSDYECPYCRRVEDTIDKLFELYPGKLRVSRRENPMPFHKRALAAAHFALEARAQRGDQAYFAASRQLFLSGLEAEHLDDIAKQLKLDTARMRRAVDKQSHRAIIERDQDLAISLNATGTPHFFVNGWRVSGAQPLTRFRDVIDAQLKVAESLVAKGVPPARVYDEILKRGKEAEPPERWRQLPAPAADAPSRGPRAAPIVIQIFGDLECAFCARVSDTLAEVEKLYAGKVRLVWRHLPLESIHDHARPAARATIEARLQKGDDALFRLVELFYRDLGERDAFSDDRLRDYARQIGLDAERLLAASKDTRHDAVIDADIAAAEQAAIRATPSFSINGYRLTGAQPVVAFRRVINYALAQRAAKKP